jgi:hypothetical protein
MKVTGTIERERKFRKRLKFYCLFGGYKNFSEMRNKNLEGQLQTITSLAPKVTSLVRAIFCASLKA